MTTRTTLLATLLGLLLLWASCSQANKTEEEIKEEVMEKIKKELPTEINGIPEEMEIISEEEEIEMPKKEKTTDIEEEQDVLVLHKINFDRALKENQILMVEFYAPWCQHCREFEPNYSDAAEKLKQEKSAIRLAKVDGEEEKELSLEFNIKGYPTLFLFLNADRKNPITYTGKRSAESLIRWLKRRTGPGATILDSSDAAEQFNNAHNISVVGFFESLDSEAAKAFNKVVMDVTEAEFAITSSSEVFEKYDVKPNSVVLFKKFDEGRADFALSENGTVDKDKLTSFIEVNCLELVITYTSEIAEKIFTSSVRNHNLLFINSIVEHQKALLDEFRAVAKEFRGKIIFIVIDVAAGHSNVLQYFGISETDIPNMRLFKMESGKKYAIQSGNITADAIRQLCQDVLDGTAKPYYKTQEIPEDWNKGPVKVLVGKNFNEVALDPTKNVFVMLYAPWCGHCKNVAPIWEELGKKYADHDNIIISKMDATENEVESIEIQGFPTFKYYPTDGKEAIDYTANPDIHTFSKFLDNGGLLPEVSDEEEPGDDGDKGDDDGDGDDDEDDDGSGKFQKDDSSTKADKDGDDEDLNTSPRDEL
ncbi:protein disulfide-isomerase A2 isoform X2 [Thalassophryne amazonica]|uniref:protein disulfide-isomerase A2 isoform X2 n=1 Tax=Thalassophryne amazonica TaxID=390379 RepID=UPI001470CF70|nr:protein disulfide-isomerase A2 isoform X2 [Thalassophryne amazonica]